jgi:hypothetical protein
MVIVSLLAAGVGLALDAYAERHASSSKNDSETRRRAGSEYDGTSYGLSFNVHCVWTGHD